MSDASTAEAARWRGWTGSPDTLEERRCELCGGGDAALLHVENGFRIERCRGCHHVYVNPRPTREALSAWYGRFFEAFDPDTIEGWRRQMAGVFEQVYRLAAVKERAAGPLRVLDIGCSYGFLLEMFPRSRWEREGIELASAARDFASRRLGATIHAEPVEDLALPDAHYDVVTCVYLLEHVWDPGLMLRHLHRILKPGGLLLGVVPQTVPMYLVKKLLGLDLLSPPFHLRDYSPATMKAFLDRVGFSRIRVSPAAPMVSPHPLENLLLKVNDRLSAAIFRGSLGRMMTPVGGKLVEAWK